MPTQPHRTLMLPGPAGRIGSDPVVHLGGGRRRTAATGRCRLPPASAVWRDDAQQSGLPDRENNSSIWAARRCGSTFAESGFSEGMHDKGVGEKDDVVAVIDFLAAEYPGVPLLVAGFSFGSWVGLRAGCGDPRVTELIGLGLPVGDLDSRSFSYLEHCDKPKLLVSGEFDRFGPPNKLRAMVERFPPQVREHTRVAIIARRGSLLRGTSSRAGPRDRGMAAGAASGACCERNLDGVQSLREIPEFAGLCSARLQAGIAIKRMPA